MRENIRLLEDRVSKAVDRLARLKAERDGLAEQVREVQEKLELLEIRNSERPEADGDPKQERAEIVASLRQTLGLLRQAADPDAAC
jgi:uncharacterized coiled-coil DUF342 family protein